MAGDGQTRLRALEVRQAVAEKGAEGGACGGMSHHDLLQGTALHGHRQAETLQQRFVAGPGSKDQAAASDAQVADFDAGAVRAVMDAIDPGCPVEVRRAEAGEALGEAHGVEDKVVEPIDDALERFRTQERGKLLGLQTLRPALQHLAGQQCRERPQAAGFGEKIGVFTCGLQASQVQLPIAVQASPPAPRHAGDGFAGPARQATERVLQPAVNHALGSQGLAAAKAVGFEQYSAVTGIAQRVQQPQACNAAAYDGGVGVDGSFHQDCLADVIVSAGSLSV